MYLELKVSGMEFGTLRWEDGVWRYSKNTAFWNSRRIAEKNGSDFKMCSYLRGEKFHEVRKKLVNIYQSTWRTYQNTRIFIKNAARTLSLDLHIFGFCVPTVTGDLRQVALLWRKFKHTQKIQHIQ
jgi:hypothetical protein